MAKRQIISERKYLFNNFQKDYKNGKLFYRARISNEPKGHSIGQMGNPPDALAKSTRANLNGISNLYIATDNDTTFYEAGANLHEYVSVRTFKLGTDIKVVNLSHSTYDVFRLAVLESLEEVRIHGTFIDKSEHELSIPGRKNGGELDYLTTQYLSEHIKSMGFDGIEF